MYLWYKLDNGKYVVIFNHDLLSADKRGSYHRKTTEGAIVDELDMYGDDEFEIDILSDRDNGKLYFVIENQKIYVSDFECYSPEELINKLCKEEEVSESLFMASLIKNADEYAFIEQKPIPSSVDIIPGFGIMVVAYSSNRRYTHVICKLVENNYTKDVWHYKLETMPINIEEQAIFGVENHYLSSYFGSVLDGYNHIILASDIDKYDFGKEDPYSEPYRRKRTR